MELLGHALSSGNKSSTIELYFHFLMVVTFYLISTENPNHTDEDKMLSIYFLLPSVMWYNKLGYIIQFFLLPSIVKINDTTSSKHFSPHPCPTAIGEGHICDKVKTMVDISLFKLISDIKGNTWKLPSTLFSLNFKEGIDSFPSSDDPPLKLGVLLLGFLDSEFLLLTVSYLKPSV